MTYVVAAGQHDIHILQKLLPDHLTQNVAFVVGYGDSSAQSLASTILTVRQQPVALIMDADTNDQTLIHERLENTEFLLKRSASDAPHAVFMAVPEIEAIFFQDKATLERLFKYRFADVDWELAKRSPKIWLTSMLKESDILDIADEQALAAWRQHPLIADLTAFLAEQATFVR